MESCQKMPKVAECKLCDYTTSKKSSFDKHLLSAKHQNRIKSNNFESVVAKSCSKKLSCKNCSKGYKSTSGLWSHSKKCKPAKLIDVIDKEFVMDLLKQNNEMYESILKNLP